MAFDAARGKVVLFGGSNFSVARNETWTWDGSNWTEYHPTVTPPARTAASMVYDDARAQIVLFGGIFGTLVPADTWTWDGSNWTNVSPALSPPARDSAGIAYDAARSKVVLFGGHTCQSNGECSNLGDTWTWDGSTWTAVCGSSVPGATAPCGPAVRQAPAMTYDNARGQTVLFGGHGGAYFADTWTWGGSSWALKCGSCALSNRSDASIAFDAARGGVVLFGGTTCVLGAPSCTFSNETWSWNGSEWSNVSSSTSPPARTRAGMAYDAGRRSLVLFGGTDSACCYMYRKDTWTWAANNSSVATKLSFTQQPSSSAVAGQPFAIQPKVAVQAANGSTVTSDNTTVVTLAKSSGGTGIGHLTCTGGLSKTVVQGVASFAGCTFDESGTYVIGATAGTLSPVDSVAITVGSAYPSGADLAITMGDGGVAGSPAPVSPKSRLTYTLTISNNGPQAATNVRISDVLPNSARFVSAASSQGRCGGTATITCNLGSLSSGNSVKVTIVVVTPEIAGELTNTARVTATEADPNPANNRATATTAVSSCAPTSRPTSTPKFLTLPLRASDLPTHDIFIDDGWLRAGGNCHKGIDFDAAGSTALPRGTPIIAAADGIAMASCQKPCERSAADSYGNFVLIQHPNGFSTLYAHLDAIAMGARPGEPVGGIKTFPGGNPPPNNRDFAQWTSVKAGDVIGYAGDSGTRYVHLHFEVAMNAAGDYQGHVTHKIDAYDIYDRPRFYPPGGAKFTSCGPTRLWIACPPVLRP